MKNIFDTFIATKPIAHRGGFWDNKTIPQHSILAFSEAIKRGYPIEFDVNVTNEGVPIVFHYHLDTEELTGKDFNLLDIKKEDLKNTYLCGTKETIPTLQEVLDFVNGRVPLLVEIKPNTYKDKNMQKNYIKIILDILKNYKNEFVVQSFHPFVLNTVRKLAPEITRGLIVSTWPKGDERETKYNPKSLIVRSVSSNMLLNFLVKPHFITHYRGTADRKKIQRLRGKMPIVAFTVQSQQEYDAVAPYVDNIIFQFFTPKK